MRFAANDTASEDVGPCPQAGNAGLGVKGHTAVCHTGVCVCVWGVQSEGAITDRMQSQHGISVCHATDDVRSAQSFG